MPVIGCVRITGMITVLRSYILTYNDKVSVQRLPGSGQGVF